MTYKDLEGLNKDRLEELKNYNQNNLTKLFQILQYIVSIQILL